MTWQGDGISSPDRSRRRERDGATLLPDPERAIEELIARYGLNQPNGPGPRVAWEVPVPRVVDAVNEVTAALRNDLPTPERRDSAVLWEVWRKAVLHVRDYIRALRPGEQMLTGSVLYAMWGLGARHAEALRSPGQLADKYCPWAAEFFTNGRLYPESV